MTAAPAIRPSLLNAEHLARADAERGGGALVSR